MRKFPLALVLLATTAHAGEVPLYAPSPDWVAAPLSIDLAKLTDAAPVPVVLDTQQRIADGTVWTWRESTSRVASTQALGQLGTIQLRWQPAHGDLTIHAVELLRGGTRIDLIAGKKPFTVLRREQQLESRILDGMLTATMPVEGLRVGDVLRVVTSTAQKDPVLKGKVQAMAPLILLPFRVQAARTRILWPKSLDLKWKAMAEGVAATPVDIKTRDGDMRELTIVLPLAKPADLPGDAPLRFRPLPLIEASSFGDWSTVAAVMAPLYVTDGLIAGGSPLDAEVAKIAAASKDPATRTAAALRLVQDELRYQLMGMESGNYVPVKPAESWASRYGDCKAKTLLLLALLHKLGITAEPVLASIGFGDIVMKRLPSAAAFNHVLVRATIDGQSLWLDGTGAGARLADLKDTPPFGWVLPIRASGAVPEQIAMRPDARPGVTFDIDIDQRAGLQLPALFDARVTLRGGVAEQLRLAVAQADKERRDVLASGAIRGLVPNALVTSRDFTFDETAGTATTIVRGIGYPRWAMDDERLKADLDDTAGIRPFTPDRGRAAWKEIPVATGAPGTVALVQRLRLPGDAKGFTLEGATALADTIGGARYDRTVTLNGTLLTLDARTARTGLEIAAADVAAERRKAATARAAPPRIVAPRGHNARWQEVLAARKTKALAPILARHDQRVAEYPDKAASFSGRGWFHAQTFDRAAAIADYTRAIGIEPSANLYLARANLYEATGDTAKAIADAETARDLDPASRYAVQRLAKLRADTGARQAGLDLLQERIDVGGEDTPFLLGSKAQIEADGGEGETAIATLDAGIVRYPGNAALLNSRCWIKGLLNTALDTALKDCTKAIELSANPAAALDSRALVYFRLDRADDAVIDLDAALLRDDDRAESLFLRGIVRKGKGDSTASATDLLGARTIDPRVAEPYKRYGIAP